MIVIYLKGKPEGFSMNLIFTGLFEELPKINKAYRPVRCLYRNGRFYYKLEGFREEALFNTNVFNNINQYNKTCLCTTQLYPFFLPSLN